MKFGHLSGSLLVIGIVTLGRKISSEQRSVFNACHYQIILRYLVALFCCPNSAQAIVCVVLQTGEEREHPFQ